VTSDGRVEKEREMIEAMVRLSCRRLYGRSRILCDSCGGLLA